MYKEYSKASFIRFKQKNMDYNDIIPKTQNTLKFPLYVVVDKLDQYCMQQYNKKTGYQDDIPTKDFVKKYLLHVDPQDQ